MTKAKTLSLFNSLVEMSNKNLSGTKWNYGLLKNINLLDGEISSISETQKKNADFMEYERLRIDLVKKFADKDEAGNVIIENGNYKFSPENLNAVNEEGKTLQEKFAVAIKEINTFLAEPADIDLYKISIDDIPKELDASNTAKIMEIIA